MTTGVPHTYRQGIASDPGLGWDMKCLTCGRVGDKKSHDAAMKVRAEKEKK